MEPEINAGAFIEYEKTDCIKSGRLYVIAYEVGGDLFKTLAVVITDGAGDLILKPSNPKYKSIKIKRGQVITASQCTKIIMIP